MNEIQDRTAAIFVALLEYGPNPQRIAERVKLPVQTVKQIIVRDETARQRYHDDLFKIRKAIEVFGLDLGRAAQYLGHTRAELQAYIEQNPAVHEVVEGLRLEAIDLAERNLRVSLERGEWAATQFALERSEEGGRRGYGNRIKVDVNREAEQLNVDPLELKARLVRAMLGDGEANQLTDGTE